MNESTNNPPMSGKVVVITGATSGIGQVAAESLARQGARIVQIARDRTRGEAALGRLREISSGAHTIHYADLSRIAEMKRVAAETAAAEPRIDALLNNAGAMFGRRQLTEDGLESTFALNHLAYFVLTHGLRDRLISSAPARIVSTSSAAHLSGTLDRVDSRFDLQSEKIYRDSGVLEWLRFGGPGYPVYARSKLLNILFTRELARRLVGTGVTANCFHPGFVATRFGDHSGGLLGFGIGIAKRFALTPEQGAETMIYLSSSPEVAGVSGQYFDKCRAVPPSAIAQDDAAAQELWRESAQLADLPE
jgi:NAD(P)-dependent dehydrogenase (short-subunit alcohol dehydrogenase family)